jgi:hypothetical protein
MEKKEIPSKEDEKIIKTHQKETKRAEKRISYLNKVKKASIFKKLLLFFRYKSFDLALYLMFVVLMFGFIGGFISKIIWEIWKMIFALHL